MEINESNLNGGALGVEAVEWILANIKHGSTILELGSGTGTIELCKFYNVISVEHDKEWIGISDAKYIHAPLKLHGNKGYWYDKKQLKSLPKDYNLLIIDGPIGANRVNFLDFTNLFRSDVPVLIDDTHREIDREMAVNLSLQWNKNVKEYYGYEKSFITLN